MIMRIALAGPGIAALLFTLSAVAQDKAVSQSAATVNGQPIPEIALQRAVKRVPAARQTEARTEILDFLIENALLDQYLQQRGVQVQPKDVDARLTQVHEEMKKEGQSVEKVMHELMLTDDELRAQITAELRWEQFVNEQATDKILTEVFDKNPEVFDGTMVRARHILVSVVASDPQSAAQARAKITSIKQTVDTEVANQLAKLPAGADEAARGKARDEALEAAFAAAAQKESACPSKQQGGDLGWFPRAGNMAEPFAAAAFALKPYQVSDVVTTRFGYHLILATGRRPGRAPKFDEVKDVVKEFFGDRLREYLCSQLKPNAKIVINPAPRN
jgi:parvulin-like peptidyl-prolyl isomerase